MSYDNSGNLRTGRMSPTERTIEQSDWSNAELTNLEVVDGAVQIPISQMPDNGVARWRFDDNSDTTVAVDSWNDNDGTISGPAYSTTARDGSYSLSFNGNDGYVDIPNMPSFVEYTVSAWLQIRNFDSTSRRAFDWRANQVGGINVPSSDNAIRFWHRDSGGTNREVRYSSPSTGVWYHVCMTWDGSTLRVYIDGNLYDSVTAEGSSSQSYSDTIGAFDAGNGNYWDGFIDDFLIYDRQLSDSEVQDLYASY